MTPKIYITYEMVFDDEPNEISEYLQVIDREWLIKFAILIIQSGNKYKQIKDYNRKLRTDTLCMTAIPPEHNVIRIEEHIKDRK